MIWRMSLLFVIALVGPLQPVKGAQSKEETSMDKVRVRYVMNDLDPAV